MSIGIPPQYMPLVVWAGLIFALTQGWKWSTRKLGIRHHGTVEKSMPLVPVTLGAVSGGLSPELVGLGAVTGAETVPWTAGVFYGLGAGMASGHIFAAVRELLPERVATRLTLEGGCNGGQS